LARFFKRNAAPKGAAPEPASDAAPPRQPRELKPEPERIGISGSVPFVRLPAPDTLFATRAKRLRTLAPDHPLGGYLAFLAQVAEAQAAVQAERPAARPPAEADTALRLEHGMPPLSRQGLDADFPEVMAALLARLELGTAPAPARDALDTLRKSSREDRLDLAVQLFEGAIPVERVAECVYVAAALQICLAGQAAGLDAKALKPVADGVCPACGGAPVASLIVGWTPADKARYLACSLCGTQWNHVRIRCTACGSGEGISYYGLDKVSGDIQVETCTTCHSFIKHLHQHRDPALDPVADDIASYGLDLKIAEEGFRKAGLNFLMIG
jgi:FdhE protein